MVRGCYLVVLLVLERIANNQAPDFPLVDEREKPIFRQIRQTFIEQLASYADETIVYVDEAPHDNP